MTTCLIIKKNGDIIEKKTNIDNESEIYKLAGFKTTSDFECRHSFKVNDSVYKVFAKNVGRANYENKYELPPPIDTQLFYGSICIFKYNNENQVQNLNMKEWEKIYEFLFGGFDEICSNSEDEIRSMDSEIYEDHEYTNEGYVKDGFVVDDGELTDESYLEYED